MGTEKKASKRIKLKRRHLIGIIGIGLLLVFLYARTLSPPQKKDSSEARASRESLQPSPPANQDNDVLKKLFSYKSSLLRRDLLENPDLWRDEHSRSTARNIFLMWTHPETITPRTEEPQKKPEAEVKNEEPAKAESNIKLMGIIEKQADIPAKELIRFAIISVGGEIVLVKKGDMVGDQYEVLQVEEEIVEVLDKATGATEKLSIEKES